MGGENVGLFTTYDFLKVLRERTVFKILIYFQMPTKLVLGCFVQFFKMSQFTLKKCSATAQNREGGASANSGKTLGPKLDRLALGSYADLMAHCGGGVGVV